MQVTEIETNETMRELRNHGTPGFPFEYYLDDIHRFDKHYIEWHWHTEVEWVYIQSGEAICLAGTERIVLRKGDGAFINSRVIHRFESLEGAQMPNVLFLPELIAQRKSEVWQEVIDPVLKSGCACVALSQTAPEDQNVLKELCHLFQLARDREVQEAAEKAGNTGNGRRTGNSRCAENSRQNAGHTDCTENWSNSRIDLAKFDIQIAAARLWRVFLQEEQERLSGSGHETDMLIQSRNLAMMQFIVKNYREKITLDEIAAAANISKSEALRCFHMGIRSTPVRYLVDFRLNRAKELLEATNDTVTEIAAEVGIDNISYFVRIFTRKFGMTPRAYRIRKKNGLFTNEPDGAIIAETETGGTAGSV